MIARGIELYGDVPCVCKAADEGGNMHERRRKKKSHGQTASKDGFIFLLRRVVRKWIDFLTSWHLGIKEYIDLLIGFALLMCVLLFFPLSRQRTATARWPLLQLLPLLLYRNFPFYLLPHFYSDVGLAECKRVHSSRCRRYRSLTHYADRFDAVHTMCLPMTGN